MKINQIKESVHVLSNKIVLIEGKLDKSRCLSNQENVNIELDKSIKNTPIGIEILSNLKALHAEDI